MNGGGIIFLSNNLSLCLCVTVCTSLSLSLPLPRSTPWVGGGAILGSTPHPPTLFGDHEWRPPCGDEAECAMLCDFVMVVQCKVMWWWWCDAVDWMMMECFVVLVFPN